VPEVTAALPCGPALLLQASAETTGKGQTAGSAHPDHQLVTRYVQNRDSVDWEIFVEKIIMAQPSPLSALCTANEVAVVIEAGPRVESFLNAKGWLRTRSSAAMSRFESSRATETF
jgi:hypothetical protein